MPKSDFVFGVWTRNISSNWSKLFYGGKFRTSVYIRAPLKKLCIGQNGRSLRLWEVHEISSSKKNWSHGTINNIIN